MKNLVIVDYMAYCNQKGEPLGHALKAIKEYAELLDSDCNISILAPSGIVNSLCKKYNICGTLKQNICLQGKQGWLKKIKDGIYELKNLQEAMRYSERGLLWFYRVDFYFFFYLFFLKKNVKIACLLYNDFSKCNMLYRYIYNKSIHKVDIVFITQKKCDLAKNNYIYIPDYYFDIKKYQQYLSLHKEDKVVCLGTMVSQKDVEGIVQVFNENAYNLEIEGYFYDKDRVENIKRNCNANITIKDAILTEEEYMTKLATAKYAILPYDMKMYKGRTSGVLQECIFLKTIPIAPNQLLQENEINGIGYNDLTEIKKYNFEELFSDAQEYYNLQMEEYKKSHVKQKILNEFQKYF